MCIALSNLDFTRSMGSCGGIEVAWGPNHVSRWNCLLWSKHFCNFRIKLRKEEGALNHTSPDFIAKSYDKNCSERYFVIEAVPVKAVITERLSGIVNENETERLTRSSRATIHIWYTHSSPPYFPIENLQPTTSQSLEKV